MILIHLYTKKFYNITSDSTKVCAMRASLKLLWRGLIYSSTQPRSAGTPTGEGFSLTAPYSILLFKKLPSFLTSLG